MWSDYFYSTGAILALSLTILAAALLQRHSAAGKPTPGGEALPPGPRGLPLLGYLPFLGTDLHREFADLAAVYGPVFKLYLGPKLAVIITSPAASREVLRDHDTIFANHDVPVSGHVASFGGSDIVFTPYGSEWKKLRKIFVREMLSKSNLDGLYSFRREAVRSSIERIDHGRPLRVISAAFTTVADAIMSMLCGGSEAAMIGGAEFGELATELMVLMGRPYVSDIFPAVAWLDLQGIERESRRVVGVFEAMFDAAIDQRRRRVSGGGDEGLKKKDFLQFLLEVHENKDSSESITMSQLKALLMDIVVGGTDTTSTTVEWTISELLKNPDSMTKVLEELNQVVGLDSLVEESHLPQLTYLNAAIKETLRLHPPLPLLVPRYPTKPTTVGGFEIPENTKIFLNVWAIQRDPSLWDNPSEFRPERFLIIGGGDEEGSFDISGNNFKFTPLGSGRRVCAGIPLAERMLSYVVASFLHSFDLKLPPNVELDMSDRFGIVVKKRHPLVVVPTPRLSNLDLYLSA